MKTRYKLTLNNKRKDVYYEIHNRKGHQIFLKTTVTLLIVFPTATVTTAYTMNMLVAETIIVGKVPLAYGEITQK